MRDRILLSHWLPKPPTQQNKYPGNPSFLFSKRWTDPERWKEATKPGPWPWFCHSWLSLERMRVLKEEGWVSSALSRCRREPLPNTQKQKCDSGTVLWHLQLWGVSWVGGGLEEEKKHWAGVRRPRFMLWFCGFYAGNLGPVHPLSGPCSSLHLSIE